MIKRTFEATEGGTDLYEKATTAVLGSMANWLATFDNVTLVNTINKTGGGKRYVLGVDGFDNLYFTLENNNQGETRMSIYIQGNESTTTRVYTKTVNIYANLTPDGYHVYAVGDIYVFAKNNILYAFCYASPNATAGGALLLTVHNNASYAYAGGDYAYKDTATADAYYYNRNGLFKCMQNEKAVKRPMIITNGSETNSPFYDYLIGVHFLNSQFYSNSFALIDVDGTKYRQVYGNGLFIDNGDDDTEGV